MKKNVHKFSVTLPNEGGLISGNVYFFGKRTSIRLEQEMWDALNDIAHREKKTIHDLCTDAVSYKTNASHTAAVRVYLLKYYQTRAFNTLNTITG